MNGLSFSVLICVYMNDDPGHFDGALSSILHQTRKPDEVIMVVDGAIPEAIGEVIGKYEAMPFFKVIRLARNSGHGNARRTGLEHCSNELVALMDADDISVPERFEKQLKCFEDDRSLSIVGGYIKEFIHDTDTVVGVREVPENNAEIAEYIKKRCPFNQVTVMFKKSDVEAAGGYVDWYCEEDYYLWVRMFQKSMKFVNIAENLVFVRAGEEMYRRRGGWRYFRSEARLQKYMLDRGITDVFTFIVNVALRFILQVLMPNGLRGFVFKKFARK